MFFGGLLPIFWRYKWSLTSQRKQLPWKEMKYFLPHYHQWASLKGLDLEVDRQPHGNSSTKICHSKYLFCALAENIKHKNTIICNGTRILACDYNMTEKLKKYRVIAERKLDQSVNECLCKPTKVKQNQNWRMISNKPFHAELPSTSRNWMKIWNQRVTKRC